MIARDKHRDHLETIRQARDAAFVARQPYDRAKDQAEHALALVRSAQDELDDFDRKEAQAVGQSWPPQSPSPEAREARRALEDNLASAYRALSTVQKNVETARPPAEQADAEVAKLIAESDTHIRAILSEEADAATIRVATATAELVKAEGAARSLAAALAGRGWFREAEKIGSALYVMPKLNALINPDRYLALIERLRTDANAEVAL